MKELAKREVDGKAAGVRHVAEEKGRLGLTEQGKLETVKGGRWSGIWIRKLGCRGMYWVDEHDVA